MADQEPQHHSSILSPHPIIVPASPALVVSDKEFTDYVRNLVINDDVRGDKMEVESPVEVEKAPTESSTHISGFSDLGLESVGDKDEMKPTTEDAAPGDAASKPAQLVSAFVEGLKSYKGETEPAPGSMENKMFTENAAIAHRSTQNPLVDLFYELEKVASPMLVRDRLEAAWARDKASTLRIIFNSRSIHLGKSDRKVFYRCCGWLAENHPKTLLVNLEWLCRRIIEKPKPESTKAKGEDSKQAEDEAKAPAVPEKTVEVGEEHEQGLSHGYWKDSLNILALAANGELRVLGEIDKVLNVKNTIHKRDRDWSNSKDRKSQRKFERNERANKLFNSNPFYQALHLTVARLFADQLKTDKALLESSTKENLANISLCAKWAPTMSGFHDEHTFVLSSIAEILCPPSQFPDINAEQDRETYLKHAREQCRYAFLAPLRKFIGAVERNITDKNYKGIKYERVPSLAMQRYSSLFVANDPDGFEKYLDKVSEGKSKISGATLLPSTLIAAVRGGNTGIIPKATNKVMQKMIEQRQHDLMAKTLDGQWKTLVQRIKDSGTLSSAIAVCDVSGSMWSPSFSDGTCPLDSSIGLSLLLAEVTKPPFGGNFISFSSMPEFIRVGGPSDKRTLKEKIKAMEGAQWGMNTNFEAVFERLILPMAIKEKLKQEDMVKTLFVFSDMQFDQASEIGVRGADPSVWDTTYDRIKTRYKEHGYEMPQIVFWNLAGGRAGYDASGGDGGDPTAPKPVTAAEQGTSLVSGYSQGLLKVFLEGGGFEEPEEAIEVEAEEEKDAEEEVDKEAEETTEEEEAENPEKEEEAEEFVQVTKKVKMDPLITVKKAINHPAYAVLTVVD